MSLKPVKGVYENGSRHMVGDGFPVRNLFPSNGVELDPFLMLDYAGPQYFPPSERAAGVGEHPHRGFETVTIAYQGSVEHRDSGGHSGVIYPGDVQWMTAASGVVHEEMHERNFARQGGTFEMVQLWVNLPRAKKMSPPTYQGLTKEMIPSVPLDGGTARVIAGEWNGVRGPAKTFSPVNVFDVRLEKGGRVEMDLPAGYSAAVVLLNGDITVNGRTVKGEALIATFGIEGERVELIASADSKVLVLSGAPLNEPVASYGPFVMNTQEEIRQAITDYRAGRMGHLG